MDDEENTLKAGDVCLDCQQRGLEKYLRYFKINLNGDTLLKCESNVCMYPYDMSSTDDDDDGENDSDAENNEIKSISETNSIKFIDDLLQQIKNEAVEQNCDYNESPPTVVNSNNESIKKTEHFKEPSNELHANFELSFFDTFENFINENSTPTANVETESAESSVNKCNFGLSASELPSLTTFDNFTVEYFVKEPLNNNASLDNNYQRPIISLPSLVDDDYETQQFDKPKINIQSIETIKSNRYNTSNMPLLTEISKVCTAIKLETKPLAKSNELLLTNATTSAMKVEVADNKDPPKTSSEQLVKNSTPSESTRTLNIPKANIMKGSDFLKKLAAINEKTPKYNIKCKNVRKKSLIKEDKNKKESLSQSTDDKNTTRLSTNEKAMDNERQAESKPLKEEINFSLEAVTEMINAKKKIESN